VRNLLARLLTVLLFTAAGCGYHSGGNFTAADQRAFDTASAETKQMWVAALAASKTNDFAGAETLLYALLHQTESAEQRTALEHLLTDVTAKFDAALKREDPAARAALEELHRNPPNRMR
jgi:hypothetical protein